jgi:ABC-type glycerol-3-phosphate transport system substrate-binding protein
VTLATTDGFGIFAGTRYPDAAWELVKFLISKDYGRAMARAHFLQPARASLVDEWADFIRQEFPEKAKDVDIPAFADGHIKGYSVTAEIFANMGDARGIARAAWEQVFTLGSAPVDTIKEASVEIEAAQQG